MNKIQEIICPICRRNILYVYKAEEPGVRRVIPVEWRCPDCHVVHQSNWFNEFVQFEYLVWREGKSFKRWIRHIKNNSQLVRRLKNENFHIRKG